MIRLLLLLAFVFVQTANANQITLRSNDGREASFTGILRVSNEGVYASRGESHRPILIRWAQLDVQHFEANAPEVPSGIYATESAKENPHAAIYNVLYHEWNVSHPRFELYFSRMDDRVQRLWDTKYDRYLSERRKTASDFERTLTALFPDEEFVVSTSGSYTGSSFPSLLSAFHAFSLATDQNNNVNRMVTQYLISSGFFQSRREELSIISDYLAAAEKTRLEQIITAIDRLSRPTSTDIDAQNLLGRWLKEYKL